MPNSEAGVWVTSTYIGFKSVSIYTDKKKKKFIDGSIAISRVDIQTVISYDDTTCLTYKNGKQIIFNDPRKYVYAEIINHF